MMVLKQKEENIGHEIHRHFSCADNVHMSNIIIIILYSESTNPETEDPEVIPINLFLTYVASITQIMSRMVI